MLSSQLPTRSSITLVVLGRALSAWRMVLVLGLALTCTAFNARSASAGCEHAAAATADSSYPDGLEPSLVGKWQYVGGQAYYLFYPQPMPCDGPKCRKAPAPVEHMSTTPLPPVKVLPVADHVGRCLAANVPTAALEIASDSSPQSPELGELLRPPRS